MGIEQIARDIWQSLGPGYSESVYHCAFEVGLRDSLIPYETERIVPVFYKYQNVGHVRADLIIDRKIVLELKSVSRLTDGYRIQIRNYLKLLDLDEGYLINFPDKNGTLEIERIIRQSSDTPTEVPCISAPISDPECTVSPSI
jgi:GxxExxY protein